MGVIDSEEVVLADEFGNEYFLAIHKSLEIECRMGGSEGTCEDEHGAVACVDGFAMLALRCWLCDVGFAMIASRCFEAVEGVVKAIDERGRVDEVPNEEVAAGGTLEHIGIEMCVFRLVEFVRDEPADLCEAYPMPPPCREGVR